MPKVDSSLISEDVFYQELKDMWLRLLEIPGEGQDPSGLFRAQGVFLLGCLRAASDLMDIVGAAELLRFISKPSSNGSENPFERLVDISRELSPEALITGIRKEVISALESRILSTAEPQSTFNFL